jgi:PAS domain-containing protein
VNQSACRRSVAVCSCDGVVTEVLRDDPGILEVGKSVRELFELQAWSPLKARVTVGGHDWDLEFTELAESTLLIAAELGDGSYDKFQAIVESMHEGYIQTDLVGKILMVNPAAVSLLGYQDEADLLAFSTTLVRGESKASSAGDGPNFSCPRKLSST